MLKIEFTPEKKTDPSFNLRVRAAISQYSNSNATLSVFETNIKEDISKIKQKGWVGMSASACYIVKLSDDFSKVEVIETKVSGEVKGLVATITDDGIKAKEFPWD